MPKKSIRSEMLRRRRALATTTCMSLSLRIQERFLATREYAVAGTLALYSPILNEVFTEEVFADAVRCRKRILYPRVGAEGLEFVRVASRRDLRRGAFGVLEPAGSDIVPMPAIDLVLVPGVAFDRAGYRLGYGKGFYDRVLHARHRESALVGFGFEFQVVARLPAETHDIRMDRIVTEDRILAFAPVEGAGSSEPNTPNEGGLRP